MTKPAPQPDDADSGSSERLAPGVEVPGDALRFSASRSGGPGGQNVNKRSTKVELRVRVHDLPISLWSKRRLIRIAGPGRTVGDEGEDGVGEVEIQITSDAERTQRGNKRACLDRLREMLINATHRPRPRKPTRPSRGAIERRIKEKKVRGERKRLRKPPERG